MAGWGAALAGAGAAAAAVAAAALWFAPPAPRQPTAPQATPAPHATPAPQAAPAAPASAAPAFVPAAVTSPVAPAPASAPAADGAGPPRPAAPPAAAPAPRFDVVRVEPDGSALFAGAAEPDARIEVRLDGRIVAETTADSEGGFVAFGSTARSADTPAPGLSRIDLSARAPDGSVGASAAPVFVAPTDAAAPQPAPPLVIRAEPERVAVVQSPARAPTGGVTLDVVSYGEDGVVEVGGRAEGLRRLRIWADALLIAETVAEPDGRWTARAGHSLEPGAYTLRVESLNASGAVTAQASSPFRRDSAAAAPTPGQLVVQPGDSLWRIAQNAYGAGVRYTVIYDANLERIRNPDLIYPGQVFTLPGPAR